jgi:DNA-binding NarL/FixJ family response regulator
MRDIMIADDHFPVRVGVELIVREVAGQDCNISFAENGNDLLSKIVEKKYDLLITDLNMPLVSGANLINQALLLQSDLKIIILTVNENPALARQFIKAGAYAFISKSSFEKDLKNAISFAHHNKKYITENQKEQFLDSILTGKDDKNPFLTLSYREREIATLLLKGMGMLEVGLALAIKATTASTIKGRLFKKLDIKNVIELYDLAQKFDFIDAESKLY